MGLLSGGDPSGAGPGYTLRPEFNPNLLKHTNGAVSMYRKDSLNCSASQFIITRGDLPMFDGGFPLFGWVKNGMDVVAEVKKGDLMKSVTVAPYTGTEACPVLTPAPEVAAQQPPMQADIDAARKVGRYKATITMENGKKIVLVLEGKQMPITVANFVKLAQSKYYDGLLFHRVENNTGFQLIQGGDPKGNGQGGPGYEIRAEKGDMLHKKGALGMARSENPNSAGSQFYIVRCDIPQLDGKYVVFGWVKEGMDVVDAVKLNDKMKTVTIEPYKGTEACPMLATAATNKC
jgi:peptidyl-prolyl cis-trans isomerase B (cyclophilin B)